MAVRRYRYRWFDWRLLAALVVLYVARAAVGALVLNALSKTVLSEPVAIAIQYAISLWPLPVIAWLAVRWLRVPVEEE